MQAAPVRADARLVEIDILRGLALFGVLAINLDTEFRVTLFEQFTDPLAHATPLDAAAAIFLSAVLAMKAFALFSFLFGMGLAIQFERFGAARWRLMIRRLLVLLALGVIHLTLIWNGDILTEYAVIGLVALPFLALRPRMIAMAAVVALVLYLSEAWWPFNPYAGVPSDYAAHAQLARAAYAGSFMDAARFRIDELGVIAPLHTGIALRTLGLMLAGAFIWKSGRLDPRAPGRRLAGVLWIASLLFGAGLSAFQIAAKPVGHVGTLISNAGPIFLCFGYAGAVLSLAQSAAGRRGLGWAAPVGRMAFSNYIAQSLMLSVLFYGFGFGLMGRLGPAAGLAITAAIFAAQVGLSRLWLSRFRFGPLEWLWRTLTYGRRQPIVVGADRG